MTTKDQLLSIHFELKSCNRQIEREIACLVKVQETEIAWLMFDATVIARKPAVNQ